MAGIKIRGLAILILMVSVISCDAAPNIEGVIESKDLLPEIELQNLSDLEVFLMNHRKFTYGQLCQTALDVKQAQARVPRWLLVDYNLAKLENDLSERWWPYGVLIDLELAEKIRRQLGLE